jgi:membrane fusion protein (multidrug efflux system)
MKPETQVPEQRTVEHELRVHREDSEAIGSSSPPKKAPLFRRPRVVATITLLAVIAIVYAATLVFHSMTHESTDDAFIDTHIVSIAPKIAGRVSAVRVNDNQVVKKRDVLIEIDPRDAEAAVAQAKANLTKAQAAQMKSEQDQKRALELFNRKVISEQERDTALQAAAAANADVEATAAAVKTAELNLKYTRVIAPIDGRVTNRAVATGDYVQLGQTIMALVPETVWVTANFKETQLRAMHPGQPVTIRVDAYPGRKLRGHIDSIQAGSGARFSLLPPENATGNYVKVVQRVPVKIVFDEQPDVQRVLGPGMSVVPEVEIGPGAGAFLKVVVGTIIAILLVILGAALLLGRIRFKRHGASS